MQLASRIPGSSHQTPDLVGNRDALEAGFSAAMAAEAVFDIGPRGRYRQ